MFASRVSLEYSKSHYAGPHPTRAGRSLGNRLGGDVDRIRAVPGRRPERRRRRLHLAKRFHMTTELALSHPLADKALIVSIYIALGVNSDPIGW